MAITAEAQKELCKCKIYSQNFQHIVSLMPYVKTCFEGKLLTFKVDFEQLQSLKQSAQLGEINISPFLLLIFKYLSFLILFTSTWSIALCVLMIQVLIHVLFKCREQLPPPPSQAVHSRLHSTSYSDPYTCMHTSPHVALCLVQGISE